MPKAWKDIELIQTCGACPEQYDAFYEGEQVGYLRLRHGWFSVRVGDVYSDLLWSTYNVKGDGMFYDDEERRKMLKKARKKIAKHFGLQERA